MGIGSNVASRGAVGYQCVVSVGERAQAFDVCYEHACSGLTAKSEPEEIKAARAERKKANRKANGRTRRPLYKEFTTKTIAEQRRGYKARMKARKTTVR